MDGRATFSRFNRGYQSDTWPNSTEMTMHIGHERAGWKGIIVAGLSFIVPAVVITGLFAFIYKEYGQLPQVQPFIYGIKPAIIAIILAAVYPLARKSLKSIELGVLGIVALIASLLGLNEIYALFGTGFMAIILAAIRNNKINSAQGFLPLPLLKISGLGLSGISSAGLFFTFLKIGAILYGSGYVLFAFLDTELVANGIITRQQLIDAIAVGQFTPGPVFSSVTFIGYQINNFQGALLATIGIFLPSFLFVALLNPLIKKMRNSKLVSVFLDAVNVASVAIIVAVYYQMGRDTITNWRTVAIAVMSLAFVFGFRKVNSAIIVLGGSLLGYWLSFF